MEINQMVQILENEKKEFAISNTVPQKKDEEILKRIEADLDSISEKITSAEENRAMYESMVDFYNSFSTTAKQLTENLNKEVFYTRYLESEIDKKKHHLDYLTLKKTLVEDKAQLNSILEKINETLDFRLKDLDNRERAADEATESKLHLMESNIEEFISTEKRIDESLKCFRTDMTKASENEYKILQQKCRESIAENTKNVEEIKTAVISFLKSCEKHNENLIKKVPSVKFKFEWKDFAVMALSFVWFTGMIIQIVMK